MTRLRSPLKQRGAHAEQWGRWQDKCRKAVQLRALGRCEGCGANMHPLDWCHLAGRNNKGIGEPWASHPALTAGLCTSGYGHVGCHDLIDRGLDDDLLQVLRWRALGRLWESFPDDMRDDENAGTALDNIRQTIAHLIDLGWGWNGTAIVQFGELVAL